MNPLKPVRQITSIMKGHSLSVIIILSEKYVHIIDTFSSKIQSFQWHTHRYADAAMQTVACAKRKRRYVILL